MAEIIKVTTTGLEVAPTIEPDGLYNDAGFFQVSFPFSNDRDLGERFDYLQLVAHDEPYDEHDAAIIVGSGGVASLAPVLPPNIWLTDYSDKLLSWMDHQIGTITDGVSGPNEYTDWVRGQHRMAAPLLRREVANFNFRHFTDSESRFGAAQVALDEAAIGLINVDFRDPDAVTSLAEFLSEQGQQVRVMNLTNMHQHVARSDSLAEATPKVDALTESLDQLPLGEDLHVIASGTGLRPLPVSHTIDELNTALRADMVNQWL